MKAFPTTSPKTLYVLLTISNVIISILSTSIFPFSSKYSSSTEQFTIVPISSPFSNEFKGNFEIVSLTGTINTMNGEFYTHIHMSAGNDKGEVFGGHLNKAIVSATCEMVINIIEGNVDRYFDEEIGLNLFKFLN